MRLSALFLLFLVYSCLRKSILVAFANGYKTGYRFSKPGIDMKLTDAQIRRAKPADKPVKLTDGGGLLLFIAPTGSKTWRYRYALAGREKLLTIGQYPGVSLSGAREARNAAKAILAQGRDPSTMKRQDRLTISADENRFEAIARDWYENRKPRWTKRHAENVLRSLERDIFPAFGALPVTDISPPVVLDALRAIEARHAIETAHRVRQRVSDVFVYAIAIGRATNDPAAIVAKALKPVKRGKQPAIVDLGGLQKAMRDVFAIPAHPQTRLAIRLLSIAVLRPGEIRQARREEFEGLDGDEPVWIVPANRMKMKRDFVVPLSTEAAETVRVASELAGRGSLLFPSPRGIHKPISENAMDYLMNRAGYYTLHVPHGFRASFSTIMNEAYPADRHVIDFMLAHAPKDKIESAYNRALYLDRRRELAEIWAKMLLVDMPSAADLLEGPRLSR